MKNNFSKLKSSNNGIIAAYLLIATSVAVTIITGLVVFVTTNYKQSTREVSSQQALQVAESGIYYYKWYLAHSLDGKNSLQIQDFWQNGDPLGVASDFEQNVSDFSGDLVGRYRIEVDAPQSNSTIVSVTSTGWTHKNPDVTESVRVRFRRPSWSEYSVLANDLVRFGEGTNVYGPIHSNNGIRFDGVANNVISSAVEEYYDPDTHSMKPGVWTSQTNEEDVFLAGKEFPVASIDFNGVTTDLNFMSTEAQSNGIYFEGDVYSEETCDWVHTGPGWWGWNWVCETKEIPVEGYHVTLRTDDKLEVRMVTDYQGADTHDPRTYKIKKETDPVIFDIPSNGLAFFGDHVWVDGQIDTAHITIVAASLNSSNDENIYINDNILYTNKDGSDIIGLVAEGDISIGLYSANDLEIDAALLAKNGRVGRDYYTDSHSNAFSKRDSIVVHGSIATNQRYGFAWTDGTGYQIRDIYFDNNLLYYPPPYFPTGNVYELDLWEDL
ncbi:MAG: hypothetical protein PF549_01920 [Patescibacteria group bacterium]|nr:hypothetical protein [Patescibacteria group bacterium]